MNRDGTSYASQFTAVCAGDARPLRRWLGEYLAEPAGPVRVSDLRLLDSLVLWNAEEDDRARQEPVLAAVARALAAAVSVPGGGPLLVRYLKYVCDEAWQSAWDVEVILNVLRHAASCWPTVASQAVEPELTALNVRLLDLLYSEIETFNAAGCGTLAAWARYAARTREIADELAEAARGYVRAACGDGSALPDDATPRDGSASRDGVAIATAVAEEADQDARYYAALATAVQAVYDHFTGEPADLTGAARALRAAEESLDDGVERSELRGHRHNVEVLTEAAGHPWLRIDHGKIVYLYPFGLYADAWSSQPRWDEDRAELAVMPAFAERMVDVACETAERWTVAGCSVADHPDLVARRLRLDDIWKGNDPLHRQYSGMSVTLPDLELPDPDRPHAPPVRFRVELRLSRLGNHYLRIEADLSGATPPQVYAAMLRVAPEYCDLAQLGTPLRPVERDGWDRSWPRLSSFAIDIIDDVARQLAEHSGLDVRRSVRPGMYHVLLSVDRASLVSPASATVPGAAGQGLASDAAERGAGAASPPQPVQNAWELVAALGAQPLSHAVRHGISSLAEWLRYPVDVDALPVVDVPRFTGELLLRTCNTTVLVMPGTPKYMRDGVEEIAEFVATLEGMFAGWQDQIAEYYAGVQGQLAAMADRIERGEDDAEPVDLESAAYARGTQELVEMQSALEARQLRLHQFVMASRSNLMFVTSPALVTSPVVRVTIDRLLAAAKFDDLRRDFEDLIDKVLGGRIDALVDALVRRQRERHEALARAVRERQEREARLLREAQERQAELRAEQRRIAARQRELRERANRRRNDVLLGGIAAIGLSGLMQIIQAGYDFKNLAAASLVAVVLVVAIAVSYLLNIFHPDRAYGDVDPEDEPSLPPDALRRDPDENR